VFQPAHDLAGANQGKVPEAVMNGDDQSKLSLDGAYASGTRVLRLPSKMRSRWVIPQRPR
jgi:hypothetical protein